jgi:hypothetical protein
MMRHSVAVNRVPRVQEMLFDDGNGKKPPPSDTNVSGSYDQPTLWSDHAAKISRSHAVIYFRFCCM